MVAVAVAVARVVARLVAVAMKSFGVGRKGCTCMGVRYRSAYGGLAARSSANRMAHEKTSALPS